MTQKLSITYQLASWVCTGLAWTNSAVLFWDGCTGHFQTQYRIVTFAVALLFGFLGGITLGMERSLSRIFRFGANDYRNESRSGLAGAWRLLYLCLIAGLFFIVLAIGSSLVAIIGRLQQGMHIFG